MNIGMMMQALSKNKIGQSSTSVVFSTPQAEFFIEVLDADEYQRLYDSAGIVNVTCAMLTDEVAMDVTFTVVSDEGSFQLTGF